MQVNITGKGMIPGLKVLAPVYNRELDKMGVMRLINFNKFRIFESATGKQITRKNIDEVFKKPVAIVSEPVVEEAPVVEAATTELVVEEVSPEATPLPEIEPVEESVEFPTENGDFVDSIIEETIESPIEVDVTEEIVTEEPVTEEVVVEETPVNTYNKKKRNKKRNNDQ